jgi:hypothetical protein
MAPLATRRLSAPRMASVARRVALRDRLVRLRSGHRDTGRRPGQLTGGQTREPFY